MLDFVHLCGILLCRINEQSRVENNGKNWQLETIAKDSQSNPNRAAEVAADLIHGDEVDIFTAASTPDTVNPVSDQAEVNEVPCITTDCPWQPYFFGRNGVPGEGLQSNYPFFRGLEDVIDAFLDIWDKSGVAKAVGGLFPNDADGNAWGHPELGLPTPLAAAGYALTDPGRYQPLSDDFSDQIAEFKPAGCEIVTGNMIPPDFATFWAQSAQQGFAPKVVTIGKALLFPSVIRSLGERGNGLTTEVWWTPSHPFSSSLTGATARELADGYVAASGRPWTQPIGFKHALFEVVADAVRRSEDLEDPESIVAGIVATDIATIVGPVNWATGPINKVTKCPSPPRPARWAATSGLDWKTTFSSLAESSRSPMRNRLQRSGASWKTSVRKSPRPIKLGKCSRSTAATALVSERSTGVARTRETLRSVPPGDPGRGNCGCPP